ncbi:endonuclease III [Xanthobacter sp. KR7-225]|uniref:endonuclease III n=1 Tax=Xanthobacter sp. KR7-225 TaxID=3156613 RepID=UPI0032B5BCB7
MPQKPKAPPSPPGLKSARPTAAPAADLPARAGTAKPGAGGAGPAKASKPAAPAGNPSSKAPPGKAAIGKAAAGAPRRAKLVAPAAAPVPAAPAPARRRAVANAAAAAHGRTLAAWSHAEIVEAFTRFAAVDPEPKGELEHEDPFTLLVAVVLSAQATDAGVNKATRGLFAAAATPAAMVALGEEGVARHIRTLGLYKGKAKNVVELSRRLLARHGGRVPRDRAALEALPGVGRKTANVVLNIAFGEPTIAVDTHLFRVANRTGLAPGATPLAVEEGLEARIPARFKLHAHHWLILHGRYICKARQPECRRCLIADLCRWPEKTI